MMSAVKKATKKKSSMNHVGVTVLRITLGLVFALHGWQKFSEFTIAGTQASFAEMGIPAANIVAPAVAALELAGGIALIIGLLTRPIAILLVGVSVGAIFAAHPGTEFFASNGGFEYELVLAAAAFAIALVGAGQWSVDSKLGGRLGKLQ